MRKLAVTVGFCRESHSIQLSPNDSTILSVLSEAYSLTGDLDLLRKCIDKAIKLNPKSYSVMSYAGTVFAFLGDIEEAQR